MSEDRGRTPRPPAWLGADAGLPPPPGFGSPLPGTPDPGGNGRRRRISLIVAAFLLVNAMFGAWLLSQQGTVATPSNTNSGRVAVDPAAKAIARIVDPAIVNIETFQHVFGAPPSRTVPLGAGTGMILTSDGQILTNNHVVNGATRIQVTIAGRPGTTDATVVGVDPTSDVALLQLHGVTGLPTITAAETSSVSVGERIVGIGNALGKGGAPTVVVGSISGLHQTITAGEPGGSSEQLTEMLRTDAQIQPGDSGGALVDMSGHVVGMITAGGTHSKSSTGPITGFAIPTEIALGIVDRIRSGEACCPIMVGVRGHLGVAVHALDQVTAHKLGVTDGALVVGVDPGGPAEKAGIVAPAIIQAIGNVPVTSADTLGPALHAYVPGQRVAVTWVDANGTHTKTVVLDKGPAV